MKKLTEITCEDAIAILSKIYPLLFVNKFNENNEKDWKLINCDDIENITELSNLKYDLNLDSLDKLELMLELENQLDININGELYNECETIDDIINYVIDLL